MKNLFLKSIYRIGIGVLCLPVLLLSGCMDNGSDLDTTPQAYVTIYHGSPDASGMDVYLNGTKISSQAFQYGDYSYYLNYDEGSNYFQFTSTGSSTSIAEAVMPLKAGTSYSLFLVDRLSLIDTWVTKDSTQAPSVGKARLRLVHLSPDAGSLSVAVNGESTPIFSNRVFKTATEFIEIDPKTYSLDIISAGNVIKTVSGIVIAEGKYYTLAIKGFVSPPSGNTNSINLQLLPN